MTAKAKKFIARVSAKRLANEPDLQRRNSTVSASSDDRPRRSLASLKKRTKTKNANRKARKAIKRAPRTAFEDLRIYGPLVFRTWLHEQPCIVCGFRGATQQCHAKTGGTGRKDDWTRTFPGCGPHWVVNEKPMSITSTFVEGCHARIGRVGVKTFEKAMRGTLLQLAAITQQRWLAHLARQGAGE